MITRVLSGWKLSSSRLLAIKLYKINYLILGTPAYQQYLELHKVNMENVEATTRQEDKRANHRFHC